MTQWHTHQRQFGSQESKVRPRKCLIRGKKLRGKSSNRASALLLKSTRWAMRRALVVLALSCTALESGCKLPVSARSPLGEVMAKVGSTLPWLLDGDPNWQ
jgi:hypothetical protein